MEEHFIRVRRTARYHVLGDPSHAKHLWIVLHGYGQLARFFLNKFEGLAKDALIVAPEGLNRFYLDEQHQRVGATWMTREDRLHEIEDQVDYLDQLAATLRLGTSTTELHVLGFSQGVATAVRWARKGSTRIGQLVLWGGSIPPDLDPEALAEQQPAMRIALVHGESDTVVHEAVLTANERVLRRTGLPLATHRFQGGHELEPVELGRLLAG